jgi:hypothetical protein
MMKDSLQVVQVPLVSFRNSTWEVQLWIKREHAELGHQEDLDNRFVMNWPRALAKGLEGMMAIVN